MADNKLVLNGNIYSVDKAWTEGKPDITFTDKETEQHKTAHKTVLTQASPFFTAWFKEQWQQDKTSAEYPQPGDIDWKVFTNTISILYGEEVEFEEEALPDLFREADYLQLDTLKVAIVVNLTDKWQVKSESILLGMCSAVASLTDEKIQSHLLYRASVRFLIQNVQLLVKSGSEIIPTLPYSTVKEMVQSEEVTAPEIQMYRFTRKWVASKKKEITVQDMEDLYSHVRDATIPHDNPRISAECTPKEHANLTNWENQPKNIDTKRFTTRKRQQSVLLLNGPYQRKWTKRLHVDRKSDSVPLSANTPFLFRGHMTPYYCYSVASSKESDVIEMSWPSLVLIENIINIKCAVAQLNRSYYSESCEFNVSCDKTQREDEYTAPTGGAIIRTTATGIKMKTLDGYNESTTATFKHPKPWLLVISSNIPITAQTM